MAMAMRVQSPPLEYPDSDGFVDENDQDDEDDHQDELVNSHDLSRSFEGTRTHREQEAMAAMEVELRKQKKGQVIQHRHISPPLPSSSQPAGNLLPPLFLLTVDSPSRRVVERRNRVSQYDDDFIDVEIPSSPLSRPKSPIDDEITLLSFETLQQAQSITPTALGGSKFRRRQIEPTDISSPVTLSTTHDIDLPSIPLFDVHELLPSASSSDLTSIPTAARPESAPSIPFPQPPTHRQTLTACTSSGKIISISKKPEWRKVIANHDRQAAAKAQKQAYYGVDIHRLLDDIERTPNQYRFLPYNLLYIASLTFKERYSRFRNCE